MLQYLHQPLGVLHISLPHGEGSRADVVEDQIIQPSKFLQSKINHFVRICVTWHVSRYVESFLGSQTQAFLCNL